MSLYEEEKEHQIKRTPKNVVKLRSAVGVWLHLDAPTNHPQYPTSPKKYSGTFLFDKDQGAMVKAACCEALRMQLSQKQKGFEDLSEAKQNEEVELRFKIAFKDGGLPFSIQPATYTSNGVQVANPDAGKLTLKGKNTDRPVLFVATPEGYKALPYDVTPEQVDKTFYDGGIYHAILEIYPTKAGGIASSLQAVYWAGEGTRRGGSRVVPSADDFDLPSGLFDVGSKETGGTRNSGVASSSRDDSDDSESVSAEDMADYDIF